MRFYLHKLAKGMLNTYTQSVINKLCNVNGHEITDSPSAEFHLVSICDVTELPLLAKVRKMFPNAFIIAGGHFCVNYKAVAIFADLVNVGHAFDFFECKTLDEMKSLPSTYFTGKEYDRLEPSMKINWRQLPLVQTSDKMFYYLGGTGCKNKCRFCLTSWTNKNQYNSETLIKKAESLTPKGARLNVISNAYDNSLRKSPVKDMLLKDFINLKSRHARLVRVGLEFATEATRKQYGKPFPDDYILQAMEVAKKYKMEIQFFCIGGINTREEWLKLFEMIPIDPDRSPKVYFKFTNLQYQQHTPIFNERKTLAFENYLDTDFGKKLFASVGVRNKRIRVFLIATPALAFWRMGTELSTTREQYDIFAAIKNNRDPLEMFEALQNSGVMETDYSKELKFWFKK